MDYQTYTDRLNYLKELLQKGSVASPKDLARRRQCSERTVRRMINRLRERGLTIKYSRSRKKYFIEKSKRTKYVREMNLFCFIIYV